jgi:hypothetical protein
VGHGARNEEMANACNIFVGKFDGNRLLGISNCRSEDKIKMDLTEMQCHFVGSIELSVLVNTATNLRAP